MNWKLKAGITFAVFSIFINLYGQEPLKVGVVLSGGGAKGYAHIGALKVIEEAGIRIDYIAGASMGAIVGGLYAAGWSATELDSIMHATDLTSLLADPIPRDIIPFFDKVYGEKYALTLSVTDARLSLPVALSNGQMAYDLLSQLTTNVATVEDFSELPIPFFCTGTDVSTGESIIYESGNLPLTMRASGSFPGLLAPVMVDGRLIADGGILNNFPVRQMKERDVDIVIGVNVEDDLLDVNELNSFERIIMQISSFQLARNSSQQYIYTDALICPYTYGYSITSFEATDTLIQRGEQAAREIMPTLRDIARQQQAAGQLERPAPPSQRSFWQIDSVVVEPNPVLTEAAIMRKFPKNLPGPIMVEDFYTGIVNLYGTGNFRFIDYRIRETENGQFVLHLNPMVEPGYDKLFRAGLHYDDEYKSGLLLNATIQNLGIKNSILSADLILGDQFRYNLNLYIDRGKKPGFGANSRLHLNDFNFDLPNDIVLPDSLRLENLVFNLKDFSNEIYVNLFTRNSFALGLSAELKNYKFATDQLLGNTDFLNILNDRGWYFTGTAFFRFDSRDRRYFSKSGIYSTVFARHVIPIEFLPGSIQNHDPGYNGDLEFKAFIPATDRFTLGCSTRIGLTFGEHPAPYRYYMGGNNQNTINNFKSFVGLHFADLAGSGLATAGLSGQYQLFKNHYLTLSGHYGYLKGAFEGRKFNLTSFGISYGIDTLLGPVEVTYGISNRQDSFYFNLGYWF